MGLWPFKQKVPSLREIKLLDGLTDWHSHILPGVDDGVKTMEESLKILADMEQMGVKELWLTPHIMEDVPNETRFLQGRFDELKKEYKGNIKLHLAAENMLDNLFEDRLEVNDFLPLGEKGDMLLVETSYYNPPMNMTRLLEQVMSAGYFPVLAHPERYRYMDEEDYRRLKEMGVKFQANYFSITGAYGETARKKLEWLLKGEMIDMVGSDLHKRSVLHHILDKSASKARHNDTLKKAADKGSRRISI